MAEATIGVDNYRFLQQHVHRHAGIVLDDTKHYLFENRLSPIVRSLGLSSIDDLCVVLRSPGKDEIGRQVVEAMTTNETFFFRDPAHYAAIRTELLPRLRKERGDVKRLRFWSAASSTGQEAYSLAMALIEEGFGDWNIQILGTDLSSAVLARAREGVFQQLEVNRGLPAAMLVKYFVRKGMDWQVKDELRRMVRFEPIDLRASMRALGPFDLVFCRNVLIYFDQETKKQIIEQIHGTLFRDGWLLVGGAETVFGSEPWFERRTTGGASIYVAK